MVPGQKASILDLVFSHEEHDVVNVNYSEPIGKSDHTMLRFEWRETISGHYTHPFLGGTYGAQTSIDMLSAATKIDWNFASNRAA